LIAAGIDLMRVQRRAGHESIITTTERYGHLAPETDDEISNVLDGEPRRALLSPDAARIVDR
jgi:site-specific recombinase XerD